MKSMDLLETIGSIQDRYILEARTQKVTHKKRVPSRRLFLIAAIIALMLLLVGCAVIYMLSMQNIKLGEQQEVYDIFSDDGSEYLGQETVTEQVLTLAGIKGTPGYQAALEWFEFKQTYDDTLNNVLSTMQKPRVPARCGWEGSLGENGYMYMYA